MAQCKCPQEWSEWVAWLAAGLHGRNRWRLSVILLGMLFARGRRTVTSWLRAAAAPGHFSGYYYFLAALGRNSRTLAERLLALMLVHLPLPERILAVIDDTPTKRYGPHVQGADIHHNPTPGPADQPFLYGHVWVTLALALRHPRWGTIARGVVVISRLRKDAHLRDVPHRTKRRGRGRPRKYGKKRLRLAQRAAHRKGWQQVECQVYGQQVSKTYKTFLATYVLAGGVIRVVIVQEVHGCQYFFATDPAVTPQQIIEAFADRASIEQDFHDVKEVWGAGQQQVRHLWANVGAFQLNLWMQTLVELWAWHRPREDLLTDATRRGTIPRDARRKALCRKMLQHELTSITAAMQLPRKMLNLTRQLLHLAA